MKIGDRVKILVRSYQKNYPNDIVEYGTVSKFFIRDEQQKQYDVPDTVGVIKNSCKSHISEYCLDTGYQYVWGQGMTGVSDWERLSPEYIPVIPENDAPLFDNLHAISSMKP